MKTNKAIIYDDTCPMCRWYTSKFVNAGILLEHNRISFAKLEGLDLVDQIDFEIGRDEIPLVDLGGGKTIYGVDSMVHLLARKLPWLPAVVAFPPINWLMRHLYKLISYNRRIMAPSANQTIKYDCTPHFNWTYRLIYLALTFALGISLIANYALLFLAPTVQFGLLSLLLFLLHQTCIFTKTNTKMEYLGQLGTVLTLTAFCLAPALFHPFWAMPMGVMAVAMGLWQWNRRVSLLVSNHQYTII